MLLHYFITPNNLRTTTKLLVNPSNITTTDVLYGLKNPLPGTELGVPLYIFESIFTKLHYGYTPYIKYIFLIECLIGYATYGIDRYFDAIEYNNLKDKSNISQKKKDTYEYILNNKEKIEISLLTTYFILYGYFVDNNYTIPFVPLLLLNGLYKKIKIYIGIFKAPFIGMMWVLSTIILPCVIYDKNFDIINDYSSYLPAFLTLFSSSNLADINDIDEDKEKLIYTIPVVYGYKAANSISFITILLSSVILYNNPHYNDNLIPNTLFEFNNIGIMYLIYNNFNTNTKQNITINV